MRQIIRLLGILALFLLIGTTAFMLLEKIPLIDALYISCITITTVGFSDQVAPGRSFGTASRIFVICYLLSGVGVFSYVTLASAQALLSEENRSFWRRRRMEQKLKQLQSHYIVCGIGRMGTTICQYLHRRKKPFVVIDTDLGKLMAHHQEHGWLYVHGDATADDVLNRAGIERARAMATTLPTDADNVYVVLSAKILNAQIKIIARASNDSASQKMQRAGATRVISPFSSGAIKMARLMLHPNVEDFLEIANDRGIDLEIADILVSTNSPLIGKKLAETNFREQGIMIVGIRRTTGERLLPPTGSDMIELGDCLFAFGSTEALGEMITKFGQD